MFNDGGKLSDALFEFKIGEGEAKMLCGAVASREGEREGQS